MVPESGVSPCSATKALLRVEVAAPVSMTKGTGSADPATVAMTTRSAPAASSGARCRPSHPRRHLMIASRPSKSAAWAQMARTTGLAAASARRFLSLAEAEAEADPDTDVRG